MNLRPLGFGLWAVSVLVSCGKDSAVSDLKLALGSIVVTSPTASSTSRLAFRDEALPTDIKPYATQKEEVAKNFDKPPSELATQLANFTTLTTFRADCYGPTWKDNANAPGTALDVNNASTYVSRPSGDLMMVAATASPTSTEACASAQLNALVGGWPNQANKIIKLQTMMLAAGAAAGLGLPAVGGSVDVLSKMPTVTGVTFTKATLSREANRTSDGNPVYKTAIEFTDASAKTGSVTVLHTPTKSDNTEFTGAIQGVFPYQSTKHQGMSMVYKLTGGVFTYVLETAANQATDDMNFFGTNYRIDFSKAAFQQTGTKMIARFDSNTNEQTVHYAWQAGQGDLASRTFAVTVSGALGSRTGLAYSGFGPKVQVLTDTTSTLWATNARCNWVVNASQSIAKVQAQTMTESGGKMIPATSKIAFAPTNTCDIVVAWAVGGSTPTAYDGAKSSITNDFVLPNNPVQGIVPAVTAESYSAT